MNSLLDVENSDLESPQLVSENVFLMSDGSEATADGMTLNELIRVLCEIREQTSGTAEVKLHDYTQPLFSVRVGKPIGFTKKRYVILD